MLADAEHVEARRIGELGCGDDLGATLCRADRDARMGVRRHIAKV